MWLILALMGISLYEIIARDLFSTPTLWSGQVLMFLFITIVLIGGGFVLYEDGHIRMDVLYSHYSPRLKAIVNVIGFIVLLIFIGLLGYELIIMAWTSVLSNEKSWSAFHGPIYPNKIVFVIAAILLFYPRIEKHVSRCSHRFRCLC